MPLNYLALKWFGGVCSTISSIKRLFVLVFALRLMGDRVLFIKMIAAVIYWQSRKWNANIHNSFLFPAISTKLGLLQSWKFTYWLPSTNIRFKFAYVMHRYPRQLVQFEIELFWVVTNSNFLVNIPLAVTQILTKTIGGRKKFWVVYLALCTY